MTGGAAHGDTWNRLGVGLLIRWPWVRVPPPSRLNGAENRLHFRFPVPKASILSVALVSLALLAGRSPQ